MTERFELERLYQPTPVHKAAADHLNRGKKPDLVVPIPLDGETSSRPALSIDGCAPCSALGAQLIDHLDGEILDDSVPYPEVNEEQPFRGSAASGNRFNGRPASVPRLSKGRLNHAIHPF